MQSINDALADLIIECCQYPKDREAEHVLVVAQALVSKPKSTVTFALEALLGQVQKPELHRAVEIVLKQVRSYQR